MARSRPKLSQSPWSGLDAVRKIMDRFGEFGESLNRMAGALHGLEDSMKHLLGVTSRVTAAMLMLHGSLAYTGKPKGNSSSSGTDSEGNKLDYEALHASNRTRKATETAADNAESKAHWDRINKEIAFNNKLKKLNDQKLKLEERAAKFKTSIDDGLLYAKKAGRRGFAKDRADALSKLAVKRANPNFVNDDATKKQYLDTRAKQKQAEADAKIVVPGTTTPVGPSDTVIKKWVLDTEYAFKSMELDPVKAQREQSQLDPKNQKENRVITQISLVGVNELGQVLKTFTQEIEPILATDPISGQKEQLYNLGNTTKDKHDDWKKNEAAKTNKVSLDDAAIALKAFSDKEGVKDAVLNKDPIAPKLVGKSALSADFPAMNNNINKPLGDAIGLGQMPEENKEESLLDPMTVAAKSIKRLLKGFAAEELESVSKGFKLDPAALNKLANPAEAGYKQEELMTLFGQTYKGGGAHDATSDAMAYGRLEVLITELSRILLTTIDNRTDDQALDEANLGSDFAKHLDSTNTAKYNASSDVQDTNAAITETEARIKAIEFAASDAAFVKTSGDKGINIPEGPRTNVSPFSMNPNGKWKEQPTLTVDNEEVLSPAKDPTATPEDYMAKLRELKALKATSLSGDTSDFDKAIDSLHEASNIDPMRAMTFPANPTVDYTGFKNDTLTETPKAHQSRVEVSPFETTGTGSFAKRPELNVDHLPAITGPHADDISYTEEMVSKIDELLASDATLMNGTTDQLKSIQEVLKAALDELKAYKGVPLPAPSSGVISSHPVVPGPHLPPPFIGPPAPPPPIPFLPKSLKDVGAQIKDFGSRLAKIGPALMNKLKEVDFTKVMGGGMENAKEAFTTLAKGAFVTATALSGAVMGLSQLASADVFATFQNSLVLLGMTVGSAFKEPMLKLSWYIQQLAGQFENMSPAVRETLTSLAEWSIYIVGASMALKAFVFIASPIAMVVKGLWSLVVALGAAVAAMGKQGIGTAIGNGIAGLMGGTAADAMGKGGSWMGPALTNTLKFAGVVAKTTIIVGLVYEAFAGLIDIIFKTNLSMTKNLGNYFAKKEEEKTERAINDSDKRPETEEDKARALKNFDENKEYAKNQIDSTPELANLFNERIQKGYAKASVWDEKLNKTDHPMHSMLNHPALHGVSHSEKENYAKTYNQAEQQYHKAKTEGNEKGMDTNRMEMASILNKTWRAGQESRGTPNKPDEHVDRLRDYASGQQMQEGFANQNKTTKASKGESEKDKAKKDFESGGGMKGLLMSLQSFRSQPSYMGVEEAHRRVQVEALKSDPLEQKINEIRSKELADMIRLLGKIEEGQPKKSPILEYTDSILRGGH
jgi:hypothetical protein